LIFFAGDRTKKSKNLGKNRIRVQVMVRRELKRRDQHKLTHEKNVLDRARKGGTEVQDHRKTSEISEKGGWVSVSKK